jgi:hypothetical protein
VSGIPQKMFDSVVSTTLSDEISDTNIEMKSTSKAEMVVVSFLDIYFKGGNGKNVDSAPDAVGENVGNCYMR